MSERNEQLIAATLDHLKRVYALLDAIRFEEVGEAWRKDNLSKAREAFQTLRASIGLVSEKPFQHPLPLEKEEKLLALSQFLEWWHTRPDLFIIVENFPAARGAWLAAWRRRSSLKE